MRFIQSNFFKRISLFLDGISVVILAYLLTAKLDTPLKLEWYQGLMKSPLTPPDWAFPVAWTFLYMTIGIAAGLIWHRKQERGEGYLNEALLFLFQLAFNFAWTWIFFDAFDPGLSLLVIVTLWVMIGVMIRLFLRTSKWAAMLLVPYFLWVGFASYLNAYIWFYNS